MEAEVGPDPGRYSSVEWKHPEWQRKPCAATTAFAEYGILVDIFFPTFCHCTAFWLPQFLMRSLLLIIVRGHLYVMNCFPSCCFQESHGLGLSAKRLLLACWHPDWPRDLAPRRLPLAVSLVTGTNVCREGWSARAPQAPVSLGWITKPHTGIFINVHLFSVAKFERGKQLLLIIIISFHLPPAREFQKFCTFHTGTDS